MAGAGSVRGMTLDIELEWGAPPAEALLPSNQTSGFYAKVARLLRAKPNEWAKVPREFSSADSAKNTAIRIRQGRMAAMPKGEFESVSHEKELWVRYTPPAEEEGEKPAGPRLVKPTPPVRDSSGVSAQIRSWAKGNGFPELPNHGRLPQNVIDAYHAAMDDQEQNEGE